MSRPKYNTKPDKNQARIVKELRCSGFDVDIICDLPGLYDIVVCSQSRCVRVEIKSSGGKLTGNEWDYYMAQKNRNTYLVVQSADEVIEWFIRQYDGKCDGLKACPYFELTTVFEDEDS